MSNTLYPFRGRVASSVAMSAKVLCRMLYNTGSLPLGLATLRDARMSGRVIEWMVIPATKYVVGHCVGEAVRIEVSLPHYRVPQISAFGYRRVTCSVLCCFDALDFVSSLSSNSSNLKRSRLFSSELLAYCNYLYGSVRFLVLISIKTLSIITARCSVPLPI